MSDELEVVPEKRKVEELVDIKDTLGFTHEPPRDLVKLRFWEKTFTVPRSDLLESPYFRRFLGEDGAFQTKPLEDGSYFINESAKDFVEILYHLRGEVFDRQQRLDSKMIRFLPADMMEIIQEPSAQKEEVIKFTSYLQKWLKTDGLKRNLACFRLQKTKRRKVVRRFFYHFNIVEVVRDLKDGFYISVDSDGELLVDAYIWMENGAVDMLVSQSPFEFMAELPKSTGTGYHDQTWIQCKVFMTREEFVMTAMEIDTLDIKLDGTADPVPVEDPFEHMGQRDPRTAGNPQYKCNRCNPHLIFDTVDELRIHTISRHPGVMIYHPPTSRTGKRGDHSAATW